MWGGEVDKSLVKRLRVPCSISDHDQTERMIFFQVANDLTVRADLGVAVKS